MVGAAEVAQGGALSPGKVGQGEFMQSGPVKLPCTRRWIIACPLARPVSGDCQFATSVVLPPCAVPATKVGGVEPLAGLMMPKDGSASVNITVGSLVMSLSLDEPW